MTSLATGHRYTVEQASYGWDVIDTETGESRGICPTEREAVKTAQQLNALHRGNAIRIGGANLKREIRAASKPVGARMLADLLEDPPTAILTLPIESLLRSVNGIGEEKGNSLLMAIGVRALGRKVDGLTERQRSSLALLLRNWATRIEDRWGS